MVVIKMHVNNIILKIAQVCTVFKEGERDLLEALAEDVGDHGDDRARHRDLEPRGAQVVQHRLVDARRIHEGGRGRGGDDGVHRAADEAVVERREARVGDGGRLAD